MRSSRRWLRFVSRAEIRLAGTVALWMALLLAATLITFSMLARHEALEEVSAGLRKELRGTKNTEGELPGARLAELGPILAAQDISLRMLEPGGEVRAIGRPWPDEAATVRGPLGYLTAARVRPDEFLVRSFVDDHGATIEAAAPLSHFVRERVEANRILVATLLGGCLVASALAAVLVRASLEPLRAATRAVEGIDEEHLEARLPVRGTGDLIDQQALAVNEVLARLAWAFARLRTFSADVAHELRTPVNRILNIAEAAALFGVTEDERAEALERVQEGALGMSRLVDSLLFLARGEEGRVDLHQAPLDLGAFAQGLSELYRPACEERSISLNVEIEAVSVSADENLLGQCVANLLDNALRHTPDGKPIRLSVSRASEGGVIRVEDSGPGVPLADRQRIFERFVQLDSARSSGSAGLGLAISRMIARLHRGELVVRETPLGGACFELTLLDRVRGGEA